MSIRDEEQIRAWSVDYALRLHPKEEVVAPSQIISEAKKIYHYITGQPPAKVLKLVNDNTKK